MQGLQLLVQLYIIQIFKVFAYSLLILRLRCRLGVCLEKYYSPLLLFKYVEH